MIFFIIVILYLLYIELKFGIRNYLINSTINYYYILDGKFNKEQFIETLKSYNFNIDNKIDNQIIVSYNSNYKILKFTIYNYENYYKINVYFNHIFFDIQSITNIIIVKADKNKQVDYIGNPVTLHLAQINNTENNIDIAYQIRNSYKNNKFLLKEKIDIFITSWVPNENYENKIKGIDTYNNSKAKMNIDFFIVLTMINNDYVINLTYL